MKSHLLFIALLLSSCQYKNTNSSDLNIVNVREGYVDSGINISKEISNIEYVPLELTNDNESMIAGILDCSITKESIFIVSSKQSGILQFDRAGHFIRKFAKGGSGPGETQQILSISADDKKNLIYVSQLFSTSIYQFDGSFVSKKEISRGFSYQYLIENDLMAEVGAEYVPINVPGMFGMGVFKLSGDTIDVKTDFLNTKLTPIDETGLKNVYIISAKDGYLCSVESNDTVFCLTPKGVKPMYYLKMNNSTESKAKAFSINNQDMLSDNYSVFDYFETDNSFYLRVIYNNRMHIYHYDKVTRKTTREISIIDPNVLVTYNRSMAGIGIKNDIDNGLPIWGRKSFPDQNIIVQYYSAPEILYLSTKLNVIKDLPNVCKNINEDSNPLLIVYHLK